MTKFRLNERCRASSSMCEDRTATTTQRDMPVVGLISLCVESTATAFFKTRFTAVTRWCQSVSPHRHGGERGDSASEDERARVAHRQNSSDDEGFIAQLTHQNLVAVRRPTVKRTFAVKHRAPNARAICVAPHAKVQRNSNASVAGGYEQGALPHHRERRKESMNEAPVPDQPGIRLEPCVGENLLRQLRIDEKSEGIASGSERTQRLKCSVGTERQTSDAKQEFPRIQLSGIRTSLGMVTASSRRGARPRTQSLGTSIKARRLPSQARIRHDAVRMRQFVQRET